MNGFINLLKPAGITSHDAVWAIRRIFAIKKTGHTGTLDPMAAGVLVVCAGSATRAAEYLESDDKEYRCELILGMTSDTGDIWGTHTEYHPEGVHRIREADVLEVLKSLEGTQKQYPPAYSAVRKNGRRLYEYAREGISVQVEPRTITVHRIRPVRMFHEPGRILFDVSCSKGTYIRSICMEIGERLGCGAAMSFLVRTRSGQFRIEDSLTLETLADAAAACEGVSREQLLEMRGEPEHRSRLREFLTPVDQKLTDFGEIRLNAQEFRKFINGGKIAFRNAKVIRENVLSDNHKFSNHVLVCGPEGTFAGTAIMDREKRIYKADKVLNR